MRHRVAVLALDDVKAFDLGIPAQVLGEAVDAVGEPLYEVITCSIGGRPVRTSQDFTVYVGHDESALAHADTVIIPSQGHTRPLPSVGGLSPELSGALAAVPASTRVVSLCTSAFVLAAAGLLDGLAATTHWGLCDEFMRRFPGIDVDPSVLFVDNGRVLTSAGAAAGIDVCLHLVRCDHGAQVANAAARRCVVAPWRDGGQSQFMEHAVPVISGSSTSATRQWALQRLSQQLRLVDLAQHASMSTRTFTRRFRAEVGQSPKQWIAEQRVDLARQLLEASDSTIDRVATVAGFGDAVVLRKHLKRYTGLAPSAYRKAFVKPKETSGGQ